MLEALLLNQLIVNGNIFDCLEKGDLYTDFSILPEVQFLLG